MRWFKKKVRPATWTEQQMCLYEKQVAAREALGRSWSCHAMNGVERLPSKLDFRDVEVNFSAPLIFDAPPPTGLYKDSAGKTQTCIDGRTVTKLRIVK